MKKHHLGNNNLLALSVPLLWVCILVIIPNSAHSTENPIAVAIRSGRTDCPFMESLGLDIIGFFGGVVLGLSLIIIIITSLILLKRSQPSPAIN